MSRNYYKLTGKVTKIGEKKNIKRVTSPDLTKVVLTIETDDKQILFAEIRNKRIELLEKEQVYEGCFVNIDYSFEGSEKNGKRYNNIFIAIIKTVN